MADQEGTAVTQRSKLLFGLVKEARQAAVGIGGYNRAVDPLLITVAHGHVAGQEDRDRSEKVAGIFPLDDLADRMLARRIAFAAVECHDQALGASIDQALRLVEHLLRRKAIIDFDHHVGIDDAGMTLCLQRCERPSAN